MRKIGTDVIMSNLAISMDDKSFVDSKNENSKDLSRNDDPSNYPFSSQFVRTGEPLSCRIGGVARAAQHRAHE